MKLEKQGKQGRQPNARLRQQRLLRGWSLQRVVEELCKLAAEEERQSNLRQPYRNFPNQPLKSWCKQNLGPGYR